MRKSWAQYKRESRKREKDRLTAQERELNTSVFRKSFSAFSEQEHRTGFGIHYLVLGNNWWDFSKDDGIEPLDPDELDEDEKAAAFNALGKAELVLSVLEDVVEALSQDIADYKRGEIETRINEIPKSALTGPNAKAALEELERLKKLRHNLSKRVRKNLPQTRAAG
ncbi:hypothetical protein E5S70_04895 [Ensifer adhaerens]|uniref:hypothetical protein n=1 Tax=Ensifer canadensis TaxID=555315 RepID=UPI00148F95F6|nr:hypothetical protein [Ensifer canadensis]NOV15432.1 hypothetical protein [Ensifer canadensis]